MTGTRVLAEIARDGQALQLLHAGARLELDRLPARSIEWLERLALPILVEVELVREGGRLYVIALGHPQPHPRVAALRAVADRRYRAALESLAVLGEGVSLDLELSVARLQAHVGLGQEAPAWADFERVCRHARLDASVLAKAFAVLGSRFASAATSRAQSVAERIESLAGPASDATLAEIVSASGIPSDHWSADTLLRLAHERLARRPVFRDDIEEAGRFLLASRAAAPNDPRVALLASRIDTATAKIAARERRAAAALLASRPDFDDVGAQFGVKLPARLREAWHAHYEGTTVGFGFIPAHKDKPSMLIKLARTLERDMPEELRRPFAPLPTQILPFAVGEHANEYFVLDLARSREDEDFPVLVLFRGRGEGWEVFPSSAAWSDGGGATSYD